MCNQGNGNLTSHRCKVRTIYNIQSSASRANPGIRSSKSSYAGVARRSGCRRARRRPARRMRRTSWSWACRWPRDSCQWTLPLVSLVSSPFLRYYRSPKPAQQRRRPRCMHAVSSPSFYLHEPFRRQGGRHMHCVSASEERTL
jgi:hypothetical protein